MIKIISKEGTGFNPFYPLFGKNRPRLVIVDAKKSKHLHLIPLNAVGCIMAAFIMLGHGGKNISYLLTTTLITSTILRIILTKTITIKSSEITSTKERYATETIDHFIYFIFISLSMSLAMDSGGYRESIGAIISIMAVIVSVAPIINMMIDRTKRAH